MGWGARNPAAGAGDGGEGGAGSWHERFSGSAYVFVGGLDRSLTEGDVLAVMAQCGEVADLNLPRDRETGKPRGFGFLAYADQRSTVLAVDNLHGARVAGRTLRVEHVLDYRRKAQELGLTEPPSVGRPAEAAAAAAPVATGTLAAGGGTNPWEASGGVFAAMRAPGGGAEGGQPQPRLRRHTSSRSRQGRRERGEDAGQPAEGEGRRRHRRHRTRAERGGGEVGGGEGEAEVEGQGRRRREAKRQRRHGGSARRSPRRRS